MNGDIREYNLWVDSCGQGVLINQFMYGLFFEDINYAGDGGLYGEKINNRSFEAYQATDGSDNNYQLPTPIPSHGWTLQGTAVAQFLHTNPLNSNNTTYMRLTASKAGDGISNDCYAGFKVEDGAVFTASFYARGDYDGIVTVSIVSGAEVLAIGCTKTFTSRFQKKKLTLSAKGSSENATVTITLSKPGTLDLDMISVFDNQTYNERENGLRKDLVEKLKDLKPGFVRFPGGCIIEGDNLSNRYQWKDTIGPVEERKQNWNRWQTESGQMRIGYCQTYGLGFYEYFLLCEDLGAKPLPIINCGMACQYKTGELATEDDVKTIYIQDALDLVEFANGEVTTTWGSKRAEMGHPEPFNLEMIGIGNEQWGEEYFKRYEWFQEIFAQKYPNIKLITSSGPAPDGEDFDSAWNWINGKDTHFTYAVDEHYYKPPQWFYDNVTRYDSYDRTKPAVFAGEYAAHGIGRRNNVEAALAEAAFMTGLEKNADVVIMASYAPLFAKSGFVQWRPDMIWFDNTTVYGTPSYYVQMLFANHKGSKTLPYQISNTATADNQPVSLYATSSYHEDSADVIIKLVNPLGEKVKIHMILDGLNLPTSANIYAINGKELAAENSLSCPENISILQSTVSDFDGTYIAEKFSIAVIRICKST